MEVRNDHDTEIDFSNDHLGIGGSACYGSAAAGKPGSSQWHRNRCMGMAEWGE